MIKAVIDTNVIVSAYITKNPDSATAKVWEAVLQCKLTPVYNEEILDEYVDVLHRRKFGIPERLINHAIDQIVTNGTSVTRGWLNFAVDSKEMRNWGYNYNPSTQQWEEYSEIKTKYELTSAINFADGSSYFVEKYFTEDAFKSLVDQFNKLYDEVED